MHSERSAPRQRRKGPDIQNPVGEAIGPWDDSRGSADEEDYEIDGFIQPDDEEPEYESGNDDEFMDDSATEDDDSGDSDESESSSAEMSHSPRHQHKRKRTNVIQSDEESESEVDDVPVRKFGKRYRVPCESSEE